MYIYICEDTYMCGWKYVFACVWIFVDVSLCLCVRVFVACIYICIHIYIDMKPNIQKPGQYQQLLGVPHGEK